MQSFDYYWKLTRPHTLPASVIPAVFGVCFAIYAEGIFHPLLAIIMVLCAALIQIATNLFNEYFDFKNGLDTEESVGIGGAIVREGISPRNVLIAAFVIYAICGVSLPFAASSLLIAVSVAMETMRQLESQMTMRHYKGFLN